MDRHALLAQCLAMTNANGSPRGAEAPARDDGERAVIASKAIYSLCHCGRVERARQSVASLVTHKRHYEKEYV